MKYVYSKGDVVMRVRDPEKKINLESVSVLNGQGGGVDSLYIFQLGFKKKVYTD